MATYAGRVSCKVVSSAATNRAQLHRVIDQFETDNVLS